MTFWEAVGAVLMAMAIWRFWFGTPETNAELDKIDAERDQIAAEVDAKWQAMTPEERRAETERVTQLLQEFNKRKPDG